MIATGPDLDRAMRMAVELETLARQYVTALAIGGPVLLTDEELAEAAGTMKGYGPAAG
jgi:L-fuculose-phosphate aldolase